MAFLWLAANSPIDFSMAFSSFCHALRRDWNAFFLAGSALENASVSSVAMPLRASLENHRWGLSPSIAPTVSAAETMVELRPTDLVAHESYPAPFDTMICAFCSLATSDVFGSKSCASHSWS